uniref:(northern house mosquito) hypothetical protein n=1 Tax=Culex pipiens TaxID=7175 RepID=A0A8D8FKS4_CULPI
MSTISIPYLRTWISTVGSRNMARIWATESSPSSSSSSSLTSLDRSIAATCGFLRVLRFRSPAGRMTFGTGATPFFFFPTFSESSERSSEGARKLPASFAALRRGFRLRPPTTAGTLGAAGATPPS